MSELPKTTAEICQLCGREYLAVYQIPDEIWFKIMSHPSGLLCPICCDVLARESGILLYWEAAVEQFPTDRCAPDPALAGLIEAVRQRGPHATKRCAIFDGRDTVCDCGWQRLEDVLNAALEAARKGTT